MKKTILSAIFSLPFLATIVVATLIISGVVYAYVNILDRHDSGFLKIGQTDSFTIIQSTNGSIAKNSLNISTACGGATAISAALNYFDTSGIPRTQPLNLAGQTAFVYDFQGNVSLALNAVQAGVFNCTLNFQNDSVTFTNFTSGFQ